MENQWYTVITLSDKKDKMNHSEYEMLGQAVDAYTFASQLPGTHTLLIEGHVVTETIN